MAAVPTGGNAMGVEYTVIDDKERVHAIWREAYAVMDAKARQHIYTHSFSDFYNIPHNKGAIRFILHVL